MSIQITINPLSHFCQLKKKIGYLLSRRTWPSSIGNSWNKQTNKHRHKHNVLFCYAKHHP